jgi:uncharacterized protein (TIGR00255 family)
MTGYGKGLAEFEDIIAEAEIKSLNSRFLDISIKLPKNLSNQEFEVRDKIKHEFKRGKLTVSVNLRKDGIENKNIFLDDSSLKNVIEILREIRSASNIEDEISLKDIILMQQYFLVENSAESEQIVKLILEAIDNAIAELKKMRVYEGKEMIKDLFYRLEKIASAVEKIEACNPDSVQDYFNKLKDRAKQLLEGSVENDERLRMELALLAERYDVTEECVRLKSHLKLFRETLENSDEAGRKLNFISQEMNREANTINNKSISSDISMIGISIKEELEKIREQIQNIE